MTGPLLRDAIATEALSIILLITISIECLFNFAKLNKHSIEMVINRIIDNASVAIASLNRGPVITSREMAFKHPRKYGATLFGVYAKKKI